MAETQNVLIPIVTGVGGVLLGTFLRPVVEEWFAKRRKTLHVEVLDNSSEFIPPHGIMTVHWGDEVVNKIIQTGLRIHNRTGRTLRNFKLEIGPEPTEDTAGKFQVYLEGNSRARFTEEHKSEFAVYDFDFLESDAVLSGSMVSTYSRNIEFAAQGDLELIRVSQANRPGWKYYTILTVAGFIFGFAISFITRMIE